MSFSGRALVSHPMLKHPMLKTLHDSFLATYAYKMKTGDAVFLMKRRDTGNCPCDRDAHERTGEWREAIPLLASFLHLLRGDRRFTFI